MIADKLDKGWNKDPGLHVFSFAQISAVTNNFSPTNKLGQGGFGPVYKVTISLMYKNVIELD